MPKQVYRLADGSRCPGVTTIIGRFKESGALINWAYKQGLDGKDMYETKQAAADAGTMAHSLIEAEIKQQVPAIMSAEGMKLEESEWQARMDLAKQAHRAFQVWAGSVNLKIIHSEYPIVSESLRVGGLLDGVGEALGELTILDWKTSNKVYVDHLIQVAAYRELWNEAYPDRPATGAHIVRFDKQFANFGHHYYGAETLKHAADAFRLMRELYDIDAFLKKAV